MPNQKTTRKPIVDLVEVARQARIRAEEDAKKFAELEKQAERVKLAKGTQDMRKATPRRGVPIVQPARGPYYVGDEGPTEDLMVAVRRALQAKPHTFQELLDATGARDNRIKGVIMRLQREGERVVNIGEPTKALWFMPTDEVLKRLIAAKRVSRDR